MIGRKLFFFSNASAANGIGVTGNSKSSSKSLFSKYEALESPKGLTAAGTASTTGSETTTTDSSFSSSNKSSSTVFSSIIWSISSESSFSSSSEKDFNHNKNKETANYDVPNEYIEVSFEEHQALTLRKTSNNREKQQDIHLDPVIEIGTTASPTNVPTTAVKPCLTQVVKHETTASATPRIAHRVNSSTLTTRKAVREEMSSSMFLGPPPPPPPQVVDSMALLESTSTVSCASGDDFSLLLDLAVTDVSTLTYDDESHEDDNSSISSFTEDDDEDIEYLLQMLHHVEEWSFDDDENAAKAKAKSKNKKKQQYLSSSNTNSNNSKAFHLSYFDGYIKNLKQQAGNNGNRKRTQKAPRTGCCATSRRLLGRKNYYEVVEDESTCSTANHKDIMNTVTHIEI